MRGGNGGGGSSQKQDESVKHMFDRIGKKVHDEIVEKDAENYVGYLKGDLQKAASTNSETITFKDTCKLVEDYYNNHVSGVADRGDPCTNLKGNANEERFSNTLGGQCTDSKIKGNKNNCGACAPYRRLHLCSHNLETIKNTTSTTSDTLLAEVCYAAKEEGASLKNYHAKYQEKYKDYGSTMCTVLARSFADIGDIVRGKDLFLGNTYESAQRKKLQQNLKTIFKKIHGGLTKNNGALKPRYKDDAPYYYKLREDWWTANRETVWEAITCKAEGNTYFRPTCSMNGSGAQAKDKCRCGNDQPGRDKSKAIKGSDDVNIVPTYFDYVPQYLRWFEEWAEDFCRLRKHKLKDAIQKCRGKNGKDKYCDLNRHDCVKTNRGDHVFVEVEDCKDCQYSCSHFVNWIDNQKLEFLKQKEKYEKEITGGSGSKKRSARASDHDGYEKKFYKELKENKYGKVGKFLDLLSEEKTCKDITDTEGGKIDFKNVNSGKHSSGSTISVDDGEKNGDIGGDDSNKTFYRTTYCEACPWCGAEQESNGGNGWKAKNDNVCNPGKDYNNYKKTEIPILTGDKTKSDMVQKYKTFCASVNGKNGAPAAAPATTASGDNATTGYCGSTNSDSSLCEPWECYYKKKENNDVNGDINFCVLQNNETVTSKKNSMHYNAFFWKWVHDMLIDSIKWRNEHSRCINKDNGNKCKSGCNTKCKCFLKWVEQKEKEWGQIKTHFNTQEDFDKEGENDEQKLLAGGMTADFALNFLLKKDELLKIIEGTYGKSKETEGIRKMLEEDAAEHGGSSVTGQKSTIVELLEHEKEDANKCLVTHTSDTCPPPQKPSSTSDPGRAATPTQAPAGHSESATEDAENADHGEDDEDEDEVEEVEDPEPEPAVEHQQQQEEEKEEEEKETPKVDRKGSTTTTPTQDDVNVCKTVKDALTSGNLDAACKQKYSEPNRYWGWKCISDTTTTSGAATAPASPLTSPDVVASEDSANSVSSAVCIPPRRRRLYVGKLQEWAKEQTQLQTQVDGGEAGGSESSLASTQASTASPSPNGDSLLTAFVESAAVETFFLWDRYKKQKEKPQGDGLPLPLQTLDEKSANGDDSDNPEKQLKEGTIPEEFKRQMFYTLGDYRDIVVRGVADDTNGGNNIILNASGTEKEKEKMQEIQNKIKEILESGDKASGQKTTPKNWWSQNGEHIWNGMICALTYKDGEEGKSPQVDTTVRTKLWDDNTKKPKPKTDGTNGKDYTYGGVRLEDENSDTQALSSGTSGEKTTLDSFIKRPPYFRYLEEWGQNFCKERKKRLKDIKYECRSHRGGHEYCSGDGHDCTNNDRNYNNMFASLDCRDCHEHCMKYKKWIDKKFEEFHNQKNKYDGELQKLNGNSNNGDDDNKKYYEELKEKKKTSAKFLEALKHCKNGQTGGEKKSSDQNNIIDFEKPETTFGPLEYCKTCPLKGVNCNGRRGTNGCIENGQKWKEVFDGINKENGKITENMNVHMIDRRGSYMKEYMNEKSEKSKESNNSLFKDSYLFKSVREQNWTCKYKGENMDLCKLNNFNKVIDLNQYTTFKVLLIYWLEDFLYGYYILKKRKIIEQCKENGENTCDKEPKIDCVCVKKWIDQKSTEWKQIQKRFNEKYKDDNQQNKSSFRSFLEELIPQSAATIDKGNHTHLEKLVKSLKCKCAENSEKERDKDANKKDMVDCLLEYLDKKATSCPIKPSDNQKQEQCQHPVLDEEPLEETEENTVGKQQPSFCPPVEEPEPVVEEEKCDPAENSEEPAAPPAESPPTPAPAPGPGPESPKEKETSPSSPTLSDEPSKPIGDILSSTIPFGIAIALTSIVFLFLKKKMKKMKKRKKEYKNKFIKIKKKKKKKREKDFKNNKNYNKNINFDKIKNEKYYQKEIKKKFYIKKK